MPRPGGICCYETYRQMVRNGSTGAIDCDCGALVSRDNELRHQAREFAGLETCAEFEARFDRIVSERANQILQIYTALDLKFDDCPTWDVVTERIVDKIRDLRGRNRSDPREQSTGLRAKGGKYTEPGEPIIYVDNGWDD